jgi:hypothetical protein
MRKNRRLFLRLALVSASSTASAEAQPTRPADFAKAAVRIEAKVPSLESKPTPNVKLAIDAPTTRGAWMMRVTNDGDVPVRIIADARLLSLEVTPRSARKPVHCELPADMRAADDLTRALVVPPKRSYSESFEPRLYCFSGGKLDALAPGAILVARLGWTGGPKTAPPFEVSPIEGVEPALGALKSIDAPPIALRDEPSASMVPPTPSDLDADEPRLSLRGPTSIDAVTPSDIEIPLTVRNVGMRAAIIRFRPEVLSFDMLGPNSVEECAWPVMPAAALREMFTTLLPARMETITVTLGSYCTGHGLDRGGLIVVWPRLDTRNASGASVGLRSFDGEVVATVPTIVRLHRGAAPVAPLARPRLEEQHR